MKLPFGDGFLELDLREVDFTRILAPTYEGQSLDLDATLSAVLPQLQNRLKAAKPHRVAILVEDKTRRNPEYPQLLSALADTILKISGASIQLIVAYGAHAPHTSQEHRRLYGEAFCQRVEIIDHDGRDDSKLIEIGTLPSGLTLKVNRKAVEADFRIICGSVEPHVFAGFTGGRKMVLPGIASVANITANHARVAQPGPALGRLEGNPLHEELQEGVKLLPIHFAIQMVRDNRERLIGLFHGELQEAWIQAVDLCRRANTVHLDRLADITMVSVGGHPKDRSLYQSHRAIRAGVQATKPGGDLIVVAAFDEGAGNAELERWFAKPRAELLALPPEAITVGLHNAYLQAKCQAACRVLFITRMNTELLAKLQLEAVTNLPALWKKLLNDHGQDGVRYLIPNGSSMLPELV